MPSDFATFLLTDMLAAFVTLHPEVSLELDLSPRRVDLLGENFDLAIRMGINAIDSLRGNRLMLRGVGLNEKELEILGVKYAGE